MEVEEALDATSPQQVFAEYDDKGELDFDYGGMLEQEPETTPLHPASAAYEESPPPRSRHASQPSSNKDAAAAAAKEHRPISYLAWKKSKSGDEKDTQVKDGTARSSRHQDNSPSRREPESSRHKETSRARSREDRRRRDSQPRKPRGSPRHRAPSPERRPPASRPRVDERDVMIVPKFVDGPHVIDRRPRLDRPARSSRDRTRSPHILRSPVHSRADRPAAYQRGRDPEVPRHAQHVPTRHATESVWPELHAPPSGRKVEDFVRPHLDRAPIRAPEFAWESAQYERATHTAYPAPAEYDYRHGQPEYHEPVGREASYRAPLYREAGYGDAGYAVAQGREVGFRPSSYDYDVPTYRDYDGSRSMELPLTSYTRADASWDAIRFPDPRHDAYPHGYSVSDDRWHDRDPRQLPARGSPRLSRADRGSPRMPRADRDPVGLSKSGSYPYSRHDRGPDYLPARDEPRQHAPRLAHEYAAPPPRSYRDGLHQGSNRDDRGNRGARPRSVSRHAEGYASAVGHVGDPYAARRQQPLPANRRPSSRGRSPRTRVPSPARDAHRHREPTRQSQHEADRPTDRARRSPDRAEPRGLEALKLTSRSFAMEAAATKPAPEPAEPGQLDVADLPPPPVEDASKVALPQAAKPSRAAVLARPDVAMEPPAGTQEGGDASPVLNVQQGFLSEEVPAPSGDRPFKRGQRSQYPADSTAGKTRDKAAKVDDNARGSDRRSSRDRVPDASKGKDANKSSTAGEAKHRSDVNGRGESRSKHKEAGDRRQDTDTGRKEGAKAVHEKPGEAARRVSTADKDEKQKDKPSSGGKDAAKDGSSHRSAAVKASPPAKGSSKDKPASEHKSDVKQAPRPPPKPKSNVAADKEDKAGKGGSRSDAVMEKQAGRKRRSRSRERSRSPKRKASSPATRTSGKDSDRKESTSGRKEQNLPPPPARPSTAGDDGELPPPPVRLAGKTTGEQANRSLPNGSDQPLPPPPPKPHSTDKATTGSKVSSDANGGAKRDSKRLPQSEEGTPASKTIADASAKDASAKDTLAKDALAKDGSAKGTSAKEGSAKDASAKDAAAKDASAKHASAKQTLGKDASAKQTSGKDASAKDASAKDASAKDALAKDASAKGSGRHEPAKTDSKKPEREAAGGRSSHKASEKTSDKGHPVVRDSDRSDDRPSNGRSGQKRARSRSPQKPLEGSKTANGAKRQAKASDSKHMEAKQSGYGTSSRSKDTDKDSRKEWMYEEKGKTLGPVSRKRLHETWQKFKNESKSKAADYLRFPVWRDGSRRKKEQIRDLLTV